jgi:hypothetical protein
LARLHLIDQDPGGHHAHLLHRHLDGGERRVDPAGLRDVVVARHGDVLGDSKPQPARCGVDAQRGQVVDGEDGGGPLAGRARKQALRGSQPALLHVA